MNNQREKPLKPAKRRASTRSIIPASLFSSAERKSTVDIVIEKFKELLKNRSLRAGDRIPSETELCESFQASRSSIREAVKSLAGFGILEVKRGDGTYVSESMSKSLFDHLLFQLLASDYDIKNLVELRETLEYGIIALALKNLTEDDMKEIELAHEKLLVMLKSGVYTSESLFNAEMDFHFAVSRASHNPLLVKIYQFTFELFQPAIMKTHHKKVSTSLHGTMIDTHSRVIESLKKQDPDLAKKAIDNVISTWIHLMD